MTPTHQPDQARVLELCDALNTYRPARQKMLAVLNLGLSNRDPLAEWSEHLVNALVSGHLAPNRVQAHFDLTTPDQLSVQVRYLANPGEAWVNEHHVRSLPGVDRYALVLFEAFTVVGVVMFPPNLTLIGAALGKRHPDQHETVQFTRRNWWTIRDDPDRSRGFGVTVCCRPGPARHDHEGADAARRLTRRNAVRSSPGERARTNASNSVSSATSPRPLGPPSTVCRCAGQDALDLGSRCPGSTSQRSALPALDDELADVDRRRVRLPAVMRAPSL